MLSDDHLNNKDMLTSTAFYDILEKIWNHGLQIKQANSALWSHLILYLRTSNYKFKERGLRDRNAQKPSVNPSTLLEKDIRYIIYLI